VGVGVCDKAIQALQRAELTRTGGRLNASRAVDQPGQECDLDRVREVNGLTRFGLH